MTDSIYKQALDSVATIIKSLDLEGIADSEVVVRKFPWDDTTIHKGITISWEDKGEGTGTNCRDAIAYPCVITMVQGTGKGWSDGMNRIAQWKQSIHRTFHNTRLITVVGTDVTQLPCKVHDKDFTLPDRYKMNYDVSQMVVMAWFHEPRVA